MKNKIIILLISILGLASCREEMNEKQEPYNELRSIGIEELDTFDESYDRYYQIYTLEGCEYIVVSPGNSHFTWGSHKGNCKNSIHKMEQRNDSTEKQKKSRANNDGDQY